MAFANRVVGLVLLVATVVGAGGCAMSNEARFRQLTGKSEEAVVDSMGVPAKTYNVGGAKYLQYEQKSTIYYPTFRQTVDYRCRVTFKLEGGRVATFTRTRDCDAVSFE